ncbi:MAG: 2-oxo acid dehydrogenase subunit E2 [Gammaproteobacteria bacterium]|nr:2-oxo acid dehydrogenase subunit E2 [Gammaproteobacteria bacterium]MDH4313832.1 2-oxo acid dehydrogenase subunit E2 [Gammaproteobacteria bacterium]MDH5213690.1 2-oxo acid dehydrogenase subunit E2 [Gammaproteobacteria bacterium]MDH5499670.1 2-oxo acid dehydrogenase subunit E2 [Gammaproteobacteria bacterium]
MTTFNLPDLGEGLPEAEIVSWHVSEGDTVKTDDPLLSVETAKAVVEVPSPYSGVIARLHAQPGDIVATGAPLVDFRDADDKAAPAAKAEQKKQEAKTADTEPARNDAATVVGNVPTGGGMLEETAIAGGGRRRKGGRVKATPSVRTEARRLGIDLADVPPSGKNGQVTSADLANFRSTAAKARTPRPSPIPGRSESLRGPRRAMAKSMTQHRDEVALCTIFDDADIHEWILKRDFTARILRATAAGCTAAPALNGFFNAQSMSHQPESRVDIAMAVDTEDGLIVPVVRNVEEMNLDQIRNEIARIKKATIERSVAPQDMINFTITVSNFGTLAGRYATPLMVPPTVAILGAGKLQHDVVAVMGGIEVHRRIPLSLSFDHRCITGGEACRFLAAAIADLEKPQ